MENTLTCWQCIFDSLLLLIIANGMPILSRDIFGAHGSWPVDFGCTFFDKKPLFGYSKTWRGLIMSVLASALITPLVDLNYLNGALFGFFAMAGDLIASFIKRRLGYTESSRFRVLDTLPESLLPLIILRETLALGCIEIIATVTLFFIFEALLSPLLFRLHIRKRPY
ncbi:MAG: CDP-archaeol synthase [Methyloprofundus sp.]|nr:CDP-archaeol synthase [Methyloprofundus sp.]MDT8425022.1 CDP-archaeol synthase [Methyloprofundus sp.]